MLQNLLESHETIFAIVLHRHHFFCMFLTRNGGWEIDPFSYYQELGTGDLTYLKGSAKLKTAVGRPLRTLKTREAGASFDFPERHSESIKKSFRAVFGKPMGSKSSYRAPKFEKTIRPALGPILGKSKKYTYVKTGQVSSMGCWLSTLAILECLIRGRFEMDVPALNDAWALGEHKTVSFDFLD